MCSMAIRFCFKSNQINSSLYDEKSTTTVIDAKVFTGYYSVDNKTRNDTRNLSEFKKLTENSQTEQRTVYASN